MAGNRHLLSLVRGTIACTVLLTAVAAWAHEGHEHVAEPRGLAGVVDPSLLGFSGLHELANIHPAFVHFPLALFPSIHRVMRCLAS